MMIVCMRVCYILKNISKGELFVLFLHNNILLTYYQVATHFFSKISCHLDLCSSYYSKNKKAWSIVPTPPQYGLGASYTPLNFYKKFGPYKDSVSPGKVKFYKKLKSGKDDFEPPTSP